MTKSLIDWVQEETTGKPPVEKIVNLDLMLSKEELRELKKKLDNNPYMEPIITVHSLDGVGWYDLTASELTNKYKNASPEELGRKCHHIISSYFDETRGLIPDIYIFVVSPVRLRFAVALSMEASRRLAEQQEQFAREKNLTPPVLDVLEEEIDIWGDKKEKEKDDEDWL